MSADILDGLRAIVRGVTEGPLQVDTVDRIPVEMLRHAVAEIAALRDHSPRVELPVTLSTVADVAIVCEASGLLTFADVGEQVTMWNTPSPVLVLRTDTGVHVHGENFAETLPHEASGNELAEAIQAARSTS